MAMSWSTMEGIGATNFNSPPFQVNYSFQLFLNPGLFFKMMRNGCAAMAFWKICSHVWYRTVFHFNLIDRGVLANNMKLHFDTYCLKRAGVIFCKYNGRSIVSGNVKVSINNSIFPKQNILPVQTASCVTATREAYSSAAVDAPVHGCILDLQPIAPPEIRNIYPQINIPAYLAAVEVYITIAIMIWW